MYLMFDSQHVQPLLLSTLQFLTRTLDQFLRFTTVGVQHLSLISFTCPSAFTFSAPPTLHVPHLLIMLLHFQLVQRVLHSDQQGFSDLFIVCLSDAFTPLLAAPFFLSLSKPHHGLIPVWFPSACFHQVGAQFRFFLPPLLPRQL